MSEELKPCPNCVQSAFEDWLEENRPSGDETSVRRQWEASSDYINLYTNTTAELRRERDEARHGEAHYQEHAARLEDAAADCDAALIERDSLRRQLEEAQSQLADARKDSERLEKSVELNKEFQALLKDMPIHGEHNPDEHGKCLCSQCAFYRRATALLKRAIP